MTALPLLGIRPTTRLASRNISSLDESSANLIFLLVASTLSHMRTRTAFVSIMKANIGHRFERDCDANPG